MMNVIAWHAQGQHKADSTQSADLEVHAGRAAEVPARCHERLHHQCAAQMLHALVEALAVVADAAQSSLGARIAATRHHPRALVVLLFLSMYGTTEMT